MKKIALFIFICLLFLTRQSYCKEPLKTTSPGTPSQVIVDASEMKKGRINVNAGKDNNLREGVYIVNRVIDGDTIVLTSVEGKSETVDLIGIDAPESEPNEKAKGDALRTGQDLATIMKMGKEATEHVKAYIKFGQEVKLEFDVEEKGKHGRVLAYVHIPMVSEQQMQYMGVSNDYQSSFEKNGVPWVYIFLNATMVKHSYAQPITIPPNVKYSDLFKQLYEEARENRKGLGIAQ